MPVIPQRQIQQFEEKVNLIRLQIVGAKSAHLDQRFLDRMDRSRSWLERSSIAVRGHDYEQAFISLWIALNALYGLPKWEMPEEQQRISNYMGQLWETDGEALEECLSSLIRNVKIRSFLHNPFLIEAKWRGGMTKFMSSQQGPQSVLDCLDHRQVGKVFEAILGRIYVLRNQIFHGCSTSNRGTNRGSLLPSIQVLMVIVPYFWGIMLCDNHPKKWGKLPYPRAAS
jgi:hypothetical protein